MQSRNPNLPRWLLFVFFFTSGFCGLAYQVIWTRLAFASFGVITPVLSVVISVFMLGLSVGSWAAGRFISPLVKKTGLSAALFYAATEFVIGLGAFGVPRLFAIGERLLLSSGESNSLQYLVLSAPVLAVSILPWCLFMGATFPVMMAYIHERDDRETDSFSYLYVANVLGAMCGTFLTAVVFIELMGFQGTLQLAAAGNFGIALTCVFLTLRAQKEKIGESVTKTSTQPIPESSRNTLVKWILFSTGFSAMAMEVVWTRLFTPVLKTQVYSFALVVFVYLGATLAGSILYRRHLKRNRMWPTSTLMGILAVAVFLPIAVGDPRFVQMDQFYTMHFLSAFAVLACIFPLCAALGYLTPGLIDSFSRGNPGEAGRAYAINVFGSILGPLAASYILLPYMSERTAVILLSLPFFAFYILLWKSLPRFQRMVSTAGSVALAVYSLFFAHNFAEAVAARSSHVAVRRDYAASVIAGDPNGTVSLLVNGIGMTTITPITKFMVHLPMAFHKDPPRSVLVICFGMGTSYRSALSWGAETTVVELVPGVPKMFGFYHADAAEVLRNPKGRIVIDDGRRFLNRTPEKYDVITIDPPPPLQTAGSSLLYSTQFYDLIKKHLKPNGIVQMWLPGQPDKLTGQAVARSAFNSFPHVRCIPSLLDWGIHILGSMEPIEQQTPEQLAARLPANARKDLLEWATPGTGLSDYFGSLVLREIPIESLLDPDPDVKITDDDPMNEYFLLRRMSLN